MRLRHGFPARAAAMLVLCCVVPLAAEAASAFDRLRGAWATAAGAPAAMEWVGSGEGFTVSFTPPGAAAVTVEFAPSARPAVLAGKVKAGWMGSMFGGDDPVNPLAEGTLFWARSADDAVYLYSLAVDDKGGFQLDRYRCVAEGDRLTVTLDRRTAAGTETTEQQLVRKS